MGDYKPSKRQHDCRYAFPYMGEKHNETRCFYERKNGEGRAQNVTVQECEACGNFKSRYIEYPITVHAVRIDKIEHRSLREAGKPVRIRPCGKEYGDKTYLGIYLGDLPIQSTVHYHEETKELSVGTMSNPAIFVFELGKIIYGCESFWQIIDDPEALKEITDKTISGQWYVQALQAMCPKDNEKEEE